jgi:hypothetical protein
MKKIFFVILVLLLSISFIGCSNGNNNSPVKEQPKQTDAVDKQSVTNLVDNFGKKLQLVSLLASEDVVKKSMKENYGDLVTPALLAKWQSDPQNAPGRVASSPWPDRIKILSANKSSNDTYEVKGEIIEVTSTEKVSGGVAAKRPITCMVKKSGKNWLIDAVTIGEYVKAGAVVYKNTQYGFNFTLPASWKGYTIVNEKWEGLASDGSQKVAETGPKISIRHPLWTNQNPRQDIPIMIFTLVQWESLQQDKFHIGAAPIGPSEIARNSEYVFALPARYNFAFPTGYEEVEKILTGNPLQPIEK